MENLEINISRETAEEIVKTFSNTIKNLKEVLRNGNFSELKRENKSEQIARKQEVLDIFNELLNQ